MGTALTRNSDSTEFRQNKLVANCQIILHFLGSCKMEESNEMKAGHAPAQKVGGVRIAPKKQKDEKVDGSPPKVSEEDKEEFGDNVPVKSFHEKPMPTHDKGASNKPKMPIQQPRK